MKFIIVAIVACLLLEAVLANPAGQGHGGAPEGGYGKSNKCQYKQDGKYAEPGSGCKKYYQCKNKKYQGPYNCQGSYKFDDKTDKCAPKAQCY